MKKIKNSLDDRILYTVTDIVLFLILLCVTYPIIYVVSCSLSSGEAVSSGRVLLFPVDFSLYGYKLVFSYKSVWTGLYNSIFYTVFGTALNMTLTVLAAYPLSRREFPLRKFGTILFTVTMIFNAGLIPTYLLMSGFGLTNNRWGYLLLGSISAYNMIIVRTYFQNSIPGELFDAAQIDGCSEFGMLTQVVLPLSKSVLAVVGMYYAVAHWNAYFNAMIYLRNPDLQPIQCVLRSILMASKVDTSEINDVELLAQLIGASELIKYSMIVVTTLPILLVYPFVQKYFQKGVMIGSVKG